MSFAIKKQLEAGVPFHDHMGIDIAEIENERAEATLRVRSELSAVDGDHIAHGGVVPALIDAVEGVLISAHNDGACPTIDIRVDYLNPVTNDLRAIGEVVQNGGSVGLVEVEVHDTDGTHVASGTVRSKTSGDEGNSLWAEKQRESSD